MTAFWKNVHLLVQGMLLNGGHLGGRFPSETTENLPAQAERNVPASRPQQPTSRSAPAELATCR